jgi:hypothetical protein
MLAESAAGLPARDGEHPATRFDALREFDPARAEFDREQRFDCA